MLLIFTKYHLFISWIVPLLLCFQFHWSLFLFSYFCLLCTSLAFTQSDTWEGRDCFITDTTEAGEKEGDTTLAGKGTGTSSQLGNALNAGSLGGLCWYHGTRVEASGGKGELITSWWEMKGFALYSAFFDTIPAIPSQREIWGDSFQPWEDRILGSSFGLCWCE